VLGTLTAVAMTAVTVLIVMRGVDDTRAGALIALGIAARSVVSVVNSISGPIVGLNGDAVSFQRRAAEFAVGDLSARFAPQRGSSYTTVLGWMIRHLDPGLFFLQQLSVVAVAIAAAVFWRTMRRLDIALPAGRIGLAFLLLLPSSMVYCSGTLREAFQLLGCVALGYAWVIRRTTGSRSALVALAAVGGLLWFLHIALLAFAICLLVADGFLRRNAGHGGRPVAGPTSRAARVLLGAVLALAALNIAPTLIEASGRSEDAGILQAADVLRSRQATQDARASYAIEIDSSNPVTAVVTLSWNWVLYNVMPLPWLAQTSLDLASAAEALVRIAIVARFVVAATKRGRRDLLLLHLLPWTLLTACWSLGTVNWGTASRHHVTSSGFLALMLASWLALRLAPEESSSAAPVAGKA
jgi:hypothetical protein